MKPIGKYLIIKQIEEQHKTESGLLLGDDQVGIRYKRATVVAVGTDVSTMAEGDVIHFDRSAGHTMILSGEAYTVILERDVVLVE